jgi:hypothetical protein
MKSRINSPLTGDKNLDFNILNELTDKDLTIVCQVNSYVRSLCNNNTFWMKRLYGKYKLNPKDAIEIKNYLSFSTSEVGWKDFYLWLNRMFLRINTNPFREKLLTDVSFINILTNALRKKEFIDDALLLAFKNKKLPIWIYQEEYQKEYKRYCFLNISPDVNTSEWEPDYTNEYSDDELLWAMLVKALESMRDDIDASINILKLDEKYANQFNLINMDA